jgi:hypothetical protein
MPAEYIIQEFVGSNGIIYYGDTLFFVDDYSVEIQSDTIDITNISIYTGFEPLPAQQDSQGNTGNQRADFPDNLPNTNKPYKIRTTDLIRKQSQYMAGRLNVDSGLRVANITCTGLCGAYANEENVMPRIGNYVRMQFSNRIDAGITIFNFPKVFIKNVTFDYNVKNYMRYTFQGISTGDFDLFPGNT